MEKFEPFTLGSLIVVAALLQGGHALGADPEREARDRYESAVKLYEEGAYDAALVELNRAAELRPSYKLFYNIGQVRFAMHDYAAAIDAYRQYLDKGGDKIPPARRDQVQKELNTLVQRVAKLSIEVDVPGAEISVDDVVVGSAPLAGPLVVNSGIRRVTVRHPDYASQSRRINLVGGGQERVSFALANPSATVAPAAPPPSAGNPEPHPSQPAPPAVSAPPRAPSAPPKTTHESQPSPQANAHSVPWLGWVLTGAFAAGAAVTGGLALSANSTLKRDRDERLDKSSSEVASEATKVRTLAVVTDTLAAAALVAGSVSLWLTLGSTKSGPESQQMPDKAARKPLELGLGLGGISMKAAF
jgi:hypothetical protein